MYRLNMMEKHITMEKNIPVKVGKNYITVKSTVQGENGQTATLTYRVNVHRRAADKTYYNEAYRNQYHYSVKDGWGNDLNGWLSIKEHITCSISSMMIQNGGQCIGHMQQVKI